MLLWFRDLMNVTEEVTIHRPNVVTSSITFIKFVNQSSIKQCLIVHLVNCHLNFNISKINIENSIENSFLP